MERFLQRHQIAELEKLFRVSKSELKTLKMLEDELMCRKLHRAQTLLSTVEKTILELEASCMAKGPSKSASVTKESTDNPQGSLWD